MTEDEPDDGRTKILALDPIHKDGLALLRARDDVRLVHLPEPTEQAIARHIRDADILLLRGRKLEARQLENAGRLRLVTRHGVGCDNLDLERLEERGIGVAVSADANLVSVAEHAFALMLAAIKSLPAAGRAVRSGDWRAREDLSARDVAGSTVLVVGFGRIGQAFAMRAACFDARVIVHDPLLPEDAVLPEGYSRATDLAAAVAGADVVSLHIPLSSESANLFGADLLGRLMRGSILVNTAQGGIVDEAALIRALDDGRPRVYATDVLAREPAAPDDPLCRHDAVIVSPHSAAMTAQGVRRMAVGSAQNALDVDRPATRTLSAG